MPPFPSSSQGQGPPGVYSESYEEVPNDDTKNHSWHARTELEYKLLSYCIEKVVSELDKNYFRFQVEFDTELEIDVEKEVVVLGNGACSFNFEGQNFVWRANKEMDIHSISSGGKIHKVKKLIQKFVKEKNPLKRKNLHISLAPDGFDCTYKNIPTTSFKDVILNEAMKEEIYDNTIFQLKKLNANNGIILHGAPGVGKSAMVQAIIAESIKEKFSTCFITTQVNFSAFGEFMQKYLAPCVCIFEDIVSYGGTRENGENPILADFLQLISGLSEGKQKIIFVATTNYLEYLDKAISNRPMRFNRKYEFVLPTNDEINQLIALYFKDIELADRQKKLCHDSGFTGSHVKELRRTCDLKKEKTGFPVEQIFDESVKTVKDSFSNGKEKLVGYQFKKT